MGTARERPTRLADKLYQIRISLDLSQNEILDHLGLSKLYNRTFVSYWETDKREPPLHVLLLYARAYGVSTDVLIDDETDLPPKRKIQRRPAKQTPKRTGKSSKRKMRKH
jgi:transcriptional regulator with XRE-family HTH domain